LKNNYIIEGNLEVKFPTIWTDEKQSRTERRKKLEKIKSEKRKNQKKEDVDA
jgi:hypothetical protein